MGLSVRRLSAATGVIRGVTAQSQNGLVREQLTRLEIPVALPTDQKVGGSSPSERTTQTGLVGNPGGACCRMGPGASERSRCVYPSSARFEGFWGRISTQNSPLLSTL